MLFFKNKLIRNSKKANFTDRQTENTCIFLAVQVYLKEVANEKKFKKGQVRQTFIAAPTLIGRPMAIHSAVVSGKGNRINPRWRPN